MQAGNRDARELSLRLPEWVPRHQLGLNGRFLDMSSSSISFVETNGIIEDVKMEETEDLPAARRWDQIFREFLTTVGVRQKNIWSYLADGKPLP